MSVLYGLLVGMPAGFLVAYLLGWLIIRRRERDVVGRVRLYTETDPWRPW